MRFTTAKYTTSDVSGKMMVVGVVCPQSSSIRADNEQAPAIWKSGQRRIWRRTAVEHRVSSKHHPNRSRFQDSPQDADMFGRAVCFPDWPKKRSRPRGGVGSLARPATAPSLVLYGRRKAPVRKKSSRNNNRNRLYWHVSSILLFRDGKLVADTCFLCPKNWQNAPKHRSAVRRISLTGKGQICYKRH